MRHKFQKTLHLAMRDNLIVFGALVVLFLSAIGLGILTGHVLAAWVG